MAQGRHLAVHQREGGVLQSVAAERDGQGPTVFGRIVDGGVGAVGKSLSPDLRIGVDEAGGTVAGHAPGVASIGRQTGHGMFPQGHLPTVGQGVAAECLVGFVQRDERVVAVGFLHPLHALHGVGHQGVDSPHEGLVLRLLVIGIDGVAGIEIVVVIDEVNGAEGPVFLHLTHHAPDAVAVVGVVLGRKGNAVVANGYQFPVGGHVESHALVHDGLQVLRLNTGQGGLREPIGNGVFGKQFHRIAPRIPVVGSLQHGLSRWLMLMPGVGEVVHVELAVPVGHHGLVVVGPGAAAAHGLDIVHTHHGLQSAIVALGPGDGLAGVVHHVTVVFDESLYKFLGGHEHGAVLMANGEVHGTCAVLEMHEVLGAVCAIDAVAVGVVVDIPPVAHAGGAWSLGERLCERLRSLAPRTVGRLGEGHLDVAHGPRVVFHHHHIVFRSSLHQSGVDVAEIGVVEELGIGKGLEVFRRGIVEPVVVEVLFLIVGKPAWHARGPDDEELLAHVVVEQFRSPHVHRSGVAHHFDEALLAPVYQVFRRGVAESPVAPPRTGPYQMERAVGTTDDRRVAHHFLLAYLWGEKHTLDGVPPQSVGAVDKAQSFGGGLMEGGRDIDVLGMNRKEAPCHK